MSEYRTLNRRTKEELIDMVFDLRNSVRRLESSKEDIVATLGSHLDDIRTILVKDLGAEHYE